MIRAGDWCRSGRDRTVGVSGATAVGLKLFPPPGFAPLSVGFDRMARAHLGGLRAAATAGEDRDRGRGQRDPDDQGTPNRLIHRASPLRCFGENRGTKGPGHSRSYPLGGDRTGICRYPPWRRAAAASIVFSASLTRDNRRREARPCTDSLRPIGMVMLPADDAFARRSDPAPRENQSSLQEQCRAPQHGRTRTRAAEHRPQSRTRCWTRRARSCGSRRRRASPAASGT